MALPDGFVRIRRWLVPLGYLVRAVMASRPDGAAGAIKQPFLTTSSWDWFAEVEKETEPVPEKSATTQPYLLGRYGFTSLEQCILLEQAGSEDRLLDVVGWVERAHKRLKMYALLGSGAEPTIQMLQDAHGLTVQRLARILEQTTEAPVRSGGDIRGHLLRQVPGLIFPTARDMADLEELVAAARNVNAWLAERGTFACRCRALSSNEII